MKRGRDDVKVQNRNLFMEYVCRNPDDEKHIPQFIKYAVDLGYTERFNSQKKLDKTDTEKLCKFWTIKTNTSPNERDIEIKTRTQTFQVPTSLILLSETFKNYLDDTDESTIYLDKTPIDAETFERLIPLLELTYALKYQMGQPNAVLSKLHELVSFQSGDIVKLFYAVNYLHIPILYQALVRTIEKLLLKLIENGNIDGMRYILDNVRGPINPAFNDNVLLKIAAKHKRASAVEYLLYQDSVNSVKDAALVPMALALANNDYETVVALFTFLPAEYIEKSAIVAANKGYSDILKFLIRNGTPKGKAGQFIFKIANEAMNANQLDVLKLVASLIKSGTIQENLVKKALAGDNSSKMIQILLQEFKPPIGALATVIAGVEQKKDAALITLNYIINKSYNATMEEILAIPEDIYYNLLKIAAKHDLGKHFNEIFSMNIFLTVSDAQLCELGKIGAANNSVDVVITVLERFTTKIMANTCGYDMLLVAASRGHADVVKEFINRGYNPSFDNNAALRYAIENFYHDVVSVLVSSKKLEPMDNSQVRHVFFQAILNNQPKVVNILLQDPRVTSLKDLRGDLKTASKQNSVDVIHELLQYSPLRNYLNPLEQKVRRDIEKGKPIERRGFYEPWEIPIAKVLKDMIIMNQ